MSTIPKVTDRTIRKHVGDDRFTAGKSFFQGGTIFDARRQGRSLKAHCQGERDETYLVQATINDKGIADANCSCPAGSGGRCKHVAALLLAWRKQPEEFTEVEDLDAALERRSKAELVVLMKQMLRQDPDLELLLEKPAVRGRSAAADPETYRRQAKEVFRRIGHGGGAAAGIAEDLQVLTETGDGFLRGKDYAAAASVYEGICTAVVEHYDGVEDEYDEYEEENALGAVVNACLEGLGRCLDGLKKDPARREVILRTVWDVYHFDAEQGGLDLGEAAQDLLRNHTTAEERRVIASWVRAALPRGKDWSDSWRRKKYGGLLLELEKETLGNEAFLRLCRETGRRHDLVKQLLRLGRLQEAVAEAKRADDFELIGLADLFARHRHGDVAERLMHERSQKSRDYRILEWLKKRAVVRRDPSAVLELTAKLFRLQPSLQSYREVRQLAQQQRRWQELRPELLESLKKSGSRSVLVQIYLDEGDIDRALETVQTERSHGYGYGMKLHVAKAAEKTRPRAALEIYRKQAESLIAHRSRNAYRAACPYLRKVRALYKQLNEEDAWRTYIARLRQRHGTLRALLEELTRARL
ncbi:MAG: SWIM zinc finger family protein [Gemmataceae bacterium]|nr:SWIM zinc finger family protein [Gemmataceae bacterium]